MGTLNQDPNTGEYPDPRGSDDKLSAARTFRGASLLISLAVTLVFGFFTSTSSSRPSSTRATSTFFIILLCAVYCVGGLLLEGFRAEG